MKINLIHIKRLNKLFTLLIILTFSFVSSGNFCPNGTATHAQMAVFLLRAKNGVGYVPPSVPTPPSAPSTTYFSDVPVDHWAAAWIKEFATLGITGGCGATTFCPEATVTHAQMAIFLLRSKYSSSYSPPSASSPTTYADVPASAFAAAWIYQLGYEGISYGANNCTPGSFCPNNPVTRAQMASMILRTFGLHD